MTNTKVSNNNPDKESIINKSITKAKNNEVIKNKTIQNKKVTSVSKKPNKSVDDISNELFSELISKKISLVKEIKDLETKKNELDKDIESNFKGQSDNIAKRVKGFQEYLTGSLQNLSQNVEKLELVSQPIVVKPSPLDEKKEASNKNELLTVPALSETFKPDHFPNKNSLLDQEAIFSLSRQAYPASLKLNLFHEMNLISLLDKK